MMVSKCNGDCGHAVGYAFAAQYKANTESNQYGKSVVFCKPCWEKGFRMWVDGNGGYAVGKSCPDGYHEAVLYWDEGGYVTGRERSDMTYPGVSQPSYR